jgi:hypothetical protein
LQAGKINRGIEMACCICGKDVAGLPVMRDNKTGLECCETCGRRIGGLRNET